MRASPIHLSSGKSKSQSAILDNLKAVTKGEEKVREVQLRGRQMPYEYVLTAMFENQDFMPNSDEVQLKSTPQMVDQSAHPLRSHFGPPPAVRCVGRSFPPAPASRPTRLGQKTDPGSRPGTFQPAARVCRARLPTDPGF